MAVDQELDNLLYAAIENMRLIRFTYRGKDRITEPHDYGIEDGIVRLLCWQVGGKSNGHVPGWRLFDVEGMEDCEMLDRVFEGSRVAPAGKHHRWDEVFIRVGTSQRAKPRMSG